MKRAILTTSIMALVLAFALAGCGSSTASSSGASSSGTATSTSSTSATASDTLSKSQSSSSAKQADANSSSSKEAASKADGQQEEDPLDAEDYVESLVWQLGLGELVSYSNFQDDDGDWCLKVVTRGADGNEYTSVIGADGSIEESDFVPTQTDADDGDNAAGGNDASSDGPAPTTYSNKEAKQAVLDYDLGQYVYSQEVQGSDGKIYQEITTRDEDGNESYSYLDSKGDVVYNVDVELRYNNDGTADPAKKR